MRNSYFNSHLVADYQEQRGVCGKLDNILEIMAENNENVAPAPAKKLKKIDHKKMLMIQMIRENPILYDINHIDHKNVLMKKVIWEKIAQVLKETGKIHFYSNVISMSIILKYTSHI